MEQFELHAAFLAEKHAVSFVKCREKLLARLKDNEAILLRANKLLNEAAKAKQIITPAAEWVLDNYYLIEEQIRLAQKYLPEGYSRELPYLSRGPMAGYPRIYDIAMEMVSHGDGRLDIKGLSAFIGAYQKIRHLKLGELWGIPIMLRLALIENLRRVSVGMILTQIDRNKADYWASRILEVAVRDTNDYIREIAAMAKDDPPMSDAFVSEFVRRLQGQSTNIDLPLTWLEKKLSEQGENMDRLIRSTSRKQAANQVSIANTIESLRLLESTDWHVFVETLSVVDGILRKDPAGVYGRMSFDTRDRYRHMIEKIALQVGYSEEDISSRVLLLASQAEKDGAGGEAASHVGYYLIDRGLELLYGSLGRRLPLRYYQQAKKTRLALWVYALSIFFSACAGTGFGLVAAYGLGLDGLKNFALFGVPLFFVFGQTAVSIVNWIATLIVKPETLPKMDFSECIPPDAHALVVTPTMLASEQGIDSLLENLEVSYLANGDPCVDFALLTDFMDAETETMSADDALLSRVVEGIERLNGKHRRQGSDVFYLFHRNRSWNERERSWMGYERKRGKLSDLNSLLRGDGNSRFGVITGDVARLQSVRYVITLDTDTRMPREAVKSLTAIAAHPLNRPIYDEKKKRVTSGYGILQPRVESSYPGETPSPFVRIFGGETGIDPYTKAVSDVYQDLFFEGSFIGKGLYDVDAFEKCLKGRLPENQILSHDMIEGCYVRSALVSEVELHEKYPTGYLKDVSRRRRWIRGDWQILQWALGSVPGFQCPRLKNPLSFLSRMKILDNLRRSLVPAFSVLLVLLGWVFLKSSWPWTVLVLGIPALPLSLKLVVDAARKPDGISLSAHLSRVLGSFGNHVLQFLLSCSFLAYEAYYSLASAVTAIWRMCVTRRRLLEWNTFAEVELAAQKKIGDHYRKMAAAPLVVIACLVSGIVPVDIPALIVLFLWVVSPAVAFVLSRSTPSRRVLLPEGKERFLRTVARRTWNFFEEFVTEGDNFLPPDNFQEDPLRGVAHRTSPTNIGLSLLSSLTAYDFGYLPMGSLLRRTGNTLGVMARMEKFRGHFYNWYDTTTLVPLEPRYISSVDSGNLTGHLIVLRSGLAEIRGEGIVSRNLFRGLSDTLCALEESLANGIDKKNEAARKALHGMTARISEFRECLETQPDSLSLIYGLLGRFAAWSAEMLSESAVTGSRAAEKWARAFLAECQESLGDIAFLAPWLLLVSELPGTRETGGVDGEGLETLGEALRIMDEVPTLNDVARLESRLLPLIGMAQKNTEANSAVGECLAKLGGAIGEAAARASERIVDIADLLLSCEELSNVEYKFLYDRNKHLFSIGYNVGEQKADVSCYDLLASESRLASYVAIAQGSIPQEHWFMLGRLLSIRGGDPLLVSWGGSMFEYLMPLLVMPDYEGTLLNRTYKSIVARQIEYARLNDVPWGISESGYNKMDVSLAYQYRSFGVPDAGFKRGLSEDLVIAPYASVMALMVEPEKACANMERLRSAGFEGEYGFYEAIDYTPSRLAKDRNYAVVKSYMAHHQGMSLLSLGYALLDRPMQRRFLADPMFKATELLLQERVPADVPYLYDAEITGPLRKIEERESLLRVFTTPDTPTPEIHLLSNGKYSVMMTNSGSGYSRWKGLAVTRWYEDAALDNEGTFVYLRDAKSGNFWSCAYQPTLKRPKSYEAVFSQSRVEFKRRDWNIDTHTEIVVSPEDDAELRRITVTNRSRDTREIELTSYAEAVLNLSEADRAHPSFSNLFVQTEIIRPYQAIVCSRRPRSDQDSFPLVLHLMAVHGNTTSGASYETDRAKFIGRLGSLANPAAMRVKTLSDSEGPVLDPIVSIRCSLLLDPQESAVVDYVTGICGTMEDAKRLMEKFRDRNLTDRVFSLAWTHGQVALQQINATEADAQLYGRLSGAIVYANPAWRAAPSILKKNLRGQSDLWGYGISGDLPIVLARIEDPANIALIAQLMQAHSYWRMKGLRVDFVIWNEDHSVYRDEMSEKINVLITKHGAGMSNQPGGIFLRRADQMSEEDKILMQTVARAVISDRGGSLSEQLERVVHPRTLRPPLATSKWPGLEYTEGSPSERTDLEYFNGLGGFTKDGREYVINTGGKGRTPAPWVNVLANRDFGTVVSESGSAYTWSENAHEFRLTPWKNDAVTDACGEALYIRDEETGDFWSPTPLPAGGDGAYISRHGFGYSVFEHGENGIESELTVFVSLDQPVKFAVLKLRNQSGKRRSLSASAYYELVMGTQREKYHMHIITEVDPKSGAMLAYNHYNKEFPDRVAFLDTSETVRFVSGDRGEFLGSNGSMKNPAAMQRDRLSGMTGAGFDPCVSLQVKFELEDNDEKTIAFTFGSGKSLDEARGILLRFGGTPQIHRELERVWEYWKRRLGVVYVETPDDSVNFLVNGWLQYQTLSCRLWGRSGYYQSGGAYGFRDQLQDVMSLMHSYPEMVREQLLVFARHQFVEGDVQHWWHPPSGRGVRTNCSDDYLWLPLVACLYVSEIGDTGVLDESVGFLEGRELKPGEESYYDMPTRSVRDGTLYEHCVLAVRRSLRFGIHGLPLIGSGDWNDGMNLVGAEGKGESVWLAFFLHLVLSSMADIAEGRGDGAFAEECAKQASLISDNVEKNAWDGDWYLRAFFDNGDALGSSSNGECKIDSIPQSWSVISRAGDAVRSRMAMDRVDALLVDRKNSLIKLFDPPFDRCVNNPGYIKGYVPGVRENGGQYTHAAVWAVMAFAVLKDRKRAWELLDIINPIRHGDSRDRCSLYKVEPYVMAGDVYSAEPNAGRGGWTWYTGSASWMYQLIVKYLLGVRIKIDRLYFEPCLHERWQSFKIHYRYRETFYHITLQRAGENDKVVSVSVDGNAQKDLFVPLVDDRIEHAVVVVIG